MKNQTIYQVKKKCDWCGRKCTCRESSVKNNVYVCWECEEELKVTYLKEGE
jgi:hypothetical protein